MLFKPSLRKKVFVKTNGKCFHCGITLETGGDDFNKNPNWFCVDHLSPKFLGGGNNIENLVPSCRKCNCKKGKKILPTVSKVDYVE